MSKPNRLPSQGSRLEQEYFYRKERELINRLHEEKRLAEGNAEKSTHLNCCAFCGTGMEQKDYRGTSYLYCQGCDSIHIGLDSLDDMAIHHRLKKFVSELLVSRPKKQNSA
jgi:hypothetical protein